MYLRLSKERGRPEWPTSSSRDLKAKPDLKFTNTSGKSAYRSTERLQLNACWIGERIEWLQIQVVENVEEVESNVDSSGLT